MDKNIVCLVEHTWNNMVSLQDIGFSFVYILDIHCGYNFYELSGEVEVDPVEN